MAILVFGCFDLTSAQSPPRPPQDTGSQDPETESTPPADPATSVTPISEMNLAEIAAAQETAEEENADDDSFREQTIYIPYNKLRDVFEKEGRGVFIPYEKFQQLWNAAKANAAPAPVEGRPVGAVIQEIESEAQIEQAAVRVKAKLKIEVPPSGWSEVPLRLTQAALKSATVDGESARIIFDPNRGYLWLVENSTDEAQQQVLELEYLKAYEKRPGNSRFDVDAPQAPINRWTVQVNEPGVDLVVEPMIASSRLPNEDDQEKTTVMAFVGIADRVSIQWNPKAEGAAGLEAFATVKAEHQIVIGEGVMRTSNMLYYEISRAALDKLEVRIPKDQKVTNVFDRNLKKWEIREEEDAQVLTAELFEPQRERQQLMIELEQFVDVGDGIELEAPLVTASNVGRQQGIVVARVEGGLQAEVIRRSGLLQLDVSELPDQIKASAWGFAFRYGATPYQLALAVRKVSPRITVTERIRATLTPDQLQLAWLGLYNIENAGVFQVRVTIPGNYEVRGITGTAMAGHQPARVESFYRESEETNQWVVNFSQRAFGLTALRIDLRQPLSDPNLATPTGNASELELPLPHVVAEGIEQIDGTIIVDAPENLRVNPAQLVGMRAISFVESAIPGELQNNPSIPVRSVLSYAFASGDSTLSLQVERRRPYITVTQLLINEIESGVIRYKSQFFVDIKYSGVKTLRIDVPDSLVDQIRNQSAQFRYQRMDPQPDDVEEGDVAWEFSTESELIGTQQINLEWESPIDELGLGSSIDFAIPHLKPRGVDRATGQIIITKSDSIDLFPLGEPVGLRPLDPETDLLPQANVERTAMAFEYVSNWELEMRATRYELQESKLTSIERGLVRIVVLPQGELAVQALYQIKSAKQRLALQLPEDAEFDAQPLRVNGQSISPERDASGTIFAPLADQNQDQAFVFEIRYTVPGTATQLSLPVFPENPAVQKIYLVAYLAPKKAVIDSSGPWTDEEVEISFDSSENHLNDEELMDWVLERIPGAGPSARTFAVGPNKSYVFSTLRPANPPDGDLHLVTMNRTALQGLVFLVVILVGLPLYGRSVRLQIVGLGVLLITLLMLSVFAPRFTMAVVDYAFWSALALVGLIWSIGYLRHWIGWTLKALTSGPSSEDGEPVRFTPAAAGAGTVVISDSTDSSPSESRAADSNTEADNQEDKAADNDEEASS